MKNININILSNTFIVVFIAALLLLESCDLFQQLLLNYLALLIIKLIRKLLA